MDSGAHKGFTGSRFSLKRLIRCGYGLNSHPQAERAWGLARDPWVQGDWFIHYNTTVHMLD